MRDHLPAVLMLALAATVMISSPTPARALDASQRETAEAAVQRGLIFLASSQNEDGSWSPQPGPAITALVLRGLADADASGNNTVDAAVTQRALAYVLHHAQPDGSIRGGADGILPNYNTAISVSALAEFPSHREAQDAVKRGVDFLRSIQWQDGMTDSQGQAVDEEHPYFGGAGYAKHGRPDLSNTQFMVQALHDAGVPADDPAYQRAVTFITRLQGTAANDYFPEGTIEPDGGVIYTTSVSKDLVGVPQSMANPELIDEARAGRPVSGLRGYGSMTYAAFKSYLYADLRRDDPRVADALEWIGANYTLDRNPGMPDDIARQGLFYYYLVHARALAAFGEPVIATSGGDVDWAANLIDALVERQRPDGSWTNDATRWMEGDPNLVTAYSVLALQEALAASE